MVEATALVKATPPRRAFGVGCFHFKPRKEPPYEFELKAYVADPRSALQAVATINNVDIDFEDIDPPYSVPVGEDLSLEDGTGVHPNPLALEVRFDVYIPARIQEEVTREDIATATTTEQFRVVVLYTYHSPVAFVESVGAEGEYRPSAAVQIVREYLRRELNNSHSPIVFECLGPSPFHAEFYLEEKSGAPGAEALIPFEVEHLRTRGYAEVTFRYAPGAYDDLDEALNALYYDLADELGLFYDFNLADVNAYRAWESLQGDVLVLTDPNALHGLIGRAREAWKQGSHISRLHTALVRFEANQVLENHRLEHHLRSTYATDEPTFLKPFLDAEAGNRPVFPTERIGRLIGFLEERRSKALELLIVLLAAIVGGVAGSFLTLLTQK